MNEGDAIVREVAAAVGLAEGEAGVRDVAAAVARLEPAPTRALSRATGLPVPIVAAVCGELRSRGVLARERPSRLTPRGRALLAAGAATVDCTCRACGGAGISTPPELVPVVAELERIAAAAPAARTELDQSHCTAATKVRRVLALHRAGALAGRTLLLLGDDDLLSVAIDRVAARLGLGAPRALTVVDVDARLLAYLRRLRVPARLVAHDLRRPLPPALAGAFDAVFTDPPYTLAGAELFLSRAAAALLPGGSVFLAFPPKPPAEAVRLQAAIAEMRFAVRSVARGFNEYRHAGLLGGVSDLHHLVAAGVPRPLRPGEVDGPLYTGDSRGPRTYRCASCRATHEVGRGARWATVDALRGDGCPECGARRFLPQRRRGQRPDHHANSFVQATFPS